VALVGTNIGAGRIERAKSAAWIGGWTCFALAETIGVAAALFPNAWMSLFDTEPTMIAAGASYLHVVGPFYGFFGLGMGLYFASQGAGVLKWPLLANALRLCIATGGGWLMLHWSGDLTYVFAALALALITFGLVIAMAFASGAWAHNQAR
jgi:Na+-driven multidrug efflux pump